MSLFLNIVAIQVNALLKSMFPGSKTIFEEFWRTFLDPSSGTVFCFYVIKMGSFEDFLSFGKRKKPDGAKSGLYGG